MTTRTKVAIGLLAAGIVASGQMARAHGMGHGRMMGGGPGRLIPLLLHSTDMTADQQTKAHQLLDTNRTTNQGILDQLRQAHKDLGTLLLSSPPPSSDAVSAQLTKIAGFQQQLQQNQAKTVLAITALLTPDQLAKANAALANLPNPHGWGHDCKDGTGPGCTAGQ